MTEGRRGASGPSSREAGRGTGWRMEREEERRPAWVAATIVLKQIEKSESEIL